ncbi:hypothetical protein KYK30_31860 [Shinella yambaruensis]|uniref:Uncharacterized protein n=1 Tax=Shinella yambaruensis TaxID=415996 RepID=A0ABQ5ZQL9_9HYPH|nr:hypothetical protein [Shinella yambaruensis]MCJ8030030.1 hypothetical protein [Shinella yambaruensis]MCU7984322.1 hypothetical protein [Shinella yambaruensis]GLR55150.1 hypothetical protein GCM10007923_63710 [Shinella yambaruensis]
MTPLPSLERDKAAFARLADIAERMQGRQWGMSSDGERVHLTTTRGGGEEVTIGTFTADALSDEIDLIAGALDDLLCFIRLRARAVEEFRELRRQLAPGDRVLRDGDFAANAAMLCAERPFQRFLEERGEGGPVRDKDAADARLKVLLNIASKRQLNDEPEAQARWVSLRGDYHIWMRG